MKHIVKLRPNSYVTLDSYGDDHENPIANILLFIVVIAISAMTGAAAFGVDITNINSTFIQRTK